MFFTYAVYAYVVSTHFGTTQAAATEEVLALPPFAVFAKSRLRICSYPSFRSLRQARHFKLSICSLHPKRWRSFLDRLSFTAVGHHIELEQEKLANNYDNSKRAVFYRCEC